MREAAQDLDFEKGGSGCATTRRCGEPWRSRPSSSATAPTPTSSRWSATNPRRRSRSSRCATGVRDPGAGSSSAPTMIPLGTQVEQFLTQFYGALADQDATVTVSAASREAGSRCPARSSSPNCRRTPTNWPSGCRCCADRVALRVPRRRRQARPAGDRRAQRLRSTFALHKLRRAGPDIAQRLSPRSRSTSVWTPPLQRIECVDISRPGHDDVSSRRWSCSRTGCRASRTIATTRSKGGRGRRPLRTTSPRSPRSPDDGSSRHRADAEQPGSPRPAKPVGPASSLIRRTCSSSTAAPQCHAAAAVLDELGITDVTVVGLASAWRRSGPSATTS